MNFHELDNFNLADVVKFHRRLNPRIWGSDEHLLPEVREKLLAIAADFQEFLGVDDLTVQDITISGSNAAYSYTANSDIDLHLVVDMPDDPVYQELFAAKKYQYNDEHDIRIAGVPVELYVQPSNQEHHSQGIYSIKDGNWTQVPQRRRARIDDSCVQHKTADLDARIHAAVKSGNADAVNRLWDKIKTMRQTGLEQNGEFGCENITFKLLRNMGCIGRLKAAKTALRDRALSLAQSRKPRERKKVNYGMRDYWYPGTAYAGQDHPAGTESQQVDESIDPDQLKKILRRFYASCVSKLELQNPPRLRLETTPEWSQENGSFGQYDPDTNTLILATSGRHVLDILRTMAHEMTHRQQDEREPLPIDAGTTGSPWEDEANAMAGRIMRHWADEQPEMFDGVTLEEASGYIPTRKQARDPRFVMALTRDVQPGATGREANKLALNTNAQGQPGLLMKNLKNALREFKETGHVAEQDLFEIRMSPSNLRVEAAKTGAIAGMEFEMIVPNVDNDDGYPEPDYDQDERCRSIDDAVQFFHDGDYNGRREVERLRERMQNDFYEWLDDKIRNDWDRDGEDFVRDWVRENVDDSEWRDLVSDDLDEQDAFEQFVSQVHGDPNNDYYQGAYDAYREDNDGSYDESDWLDAEDLDRMSNIENAYDISWPHYTSGGGEADIESVAQDFETAVGRDTQASGSYHSGSVKRPGPNALHYVVEPDGSLDGDNPGDTGLEFVSPPLPIDEILSDLNKVKAWAGNYGCYTNDSTGLHINISVPNYSRENLDFVKLALLMGDKYVLESFGRAGNTYAKSALDMVRDRVRNNPDDAARLLDKMKGNLDSLASKAIHSGITQKYTSINTKDGHIEFRSPGGDWLDENFDQIENTLLRFTVAMSAALNPEAYRKEYLTKLYKLLSEGMNKSDTDVIQLFSNYSAGELDKAALIRQVRQKQLARDVSKGKATGKMWWSVSRPGYMASIEVVASSREEAINKAVEPGNYPDWARDKNNLRATPVRPYQEEPKGPTLNGRPSNPDGNYVIVSQQDESAPVYRFMAIGDQDAISVLRQWIEANPGLYRWTFKKDAKQTLGQPGAPAQPAADNQGNWGIWINANNRFANQPGSYSRSETPPLMRFPSRAAAEQWIEQQRATRPNMRSDIEAREIEPAAPVPGSTLDLQRQRAAAAQQSDAAQGGIIDIEPDVAQNFAPQTLTRPGQAQQQFTGTWLVLDPQDREIYRFSGVGNNQSDANRVAMNWMRQNPGRMQAGVTVVPEMQ